MKILALVASQDSTVEDVKTNGRRQMQALTGTVDLAGLV